LFALLAGLIAIQYCTCRWRDKDWSRLHLTLLAANANALSALHAYYTQQGLCNGRCPSVFLSHLSIAAAACGGFAAERPAGQRYRSIAGRRWALSKCRQCHADSWRRKLNCYGVFGFLTKLAVNFSKTPHEEKTRGNFKDIG